MGRIRRVLFTVVSSVVFAMVSSALFGFALGRVVYDDPPRQEFPNITPADRDGVPSTSPTVPYEPPPSTTLPVVPTIPQLPVIPPLTLPIHPPGPWDGLPVVPPAGLPAWLAPTGQYVCWNVYGLPFVRLQDHCQEGWVGRAPERPLP